MDDQVELRFECKRCGNCCTDKNTLVNVTYNDILRIANGLNLNIDELLEIIGFYVFQDEPTKEEIMKMVVPPIETERGMAFVGIKKLADGVCYFYNLPEKRCKIYNLRPNFCRTFPFSYTLSIGENSVKSIEIYYTDKGTEYCPGIDNNSPLINMKEWIELGKKTIADLGDNNVLIENWNKSVNKGTMSKSAKNFLLTIIKLGNNKED